MKAMCTWLGPLLPGHSPPSTPTISPSIGGGNWYAWAPVEGLPIIINDARMIWAGSSGWVADPSIEGGAVDSVNGQTGVVVLDAGDVGAATAAQGATADSAVQPGDLEAIAFSGALLDATDFPGGTSDFLRADGSWATPAGGGGGSPGGSDTQIQWNNAGSFGGMTATYNATTQTLITKASATAGAGLRLPHGAAPTTGLTNGDVWTTTGGLFARINGSTQGPYLTTVTVTGWTPSTNTASPNNTVNVARMLVASASTNADGAIQPKGTGANLAQLPDGTGAGGDKRGTYATDWQKARSNSSEVASGNYSTIGGGQYNTASGTHSTVAGGQSNTASGASSCASGSSNTASGDQSVVAGGQQSTASQSYAAVGGGLLNTADADSSWIPGGRGALVRAMYGAGARASGYFASAGEAQSRCAILRANTTNATQTTMTADGGAAGATNQLILPNGSAAVVKGRVVARQDTTGDTAAWEFVAVIKRGANAAATAMVVACTPVALGSDAGAATWALAVDADTTDGGLRIRVTGQAAKTIRWVCDITSSSEVVG